MPLIIVAVRQRQKDSKLRCIAEMLTCRGAAGNVVGWGGERLQDRVLEKRELPSMLQSFAKGLHVLQVNTTYWSSHCLRRGNDCKGAERKILKTPLELGVVDSPTSHSVKPVIQRLRAPGRQGPGVKWLPLRGRPWKGQNVSKQMNYIPEQSWDLFISISEYLAPKKGKFWMLVIRSKYNP